MDKGNKNLHRVGIPGHRGLGKVVEQSKWGSDTATERYGKLDYRNGAPTPKDQSRPQFKQDQGDNGYSNDVPMDWRRGAGENGMGPNFMKTKTK